MKTSSIWQESSTWYLSWVCIDRGDNLERRYCGCGHRRIGKDGRIRNSSAEDQCKRSINTTKGEDLKFPTADGTAKVPEETTNFESPLLDRNNLLGLKISVENFKANRQGLNRHNQKMTLKPVPTSRRLKVTSSIVIKMNLEFNSMCRRGKTFPIPLTYLDVARSTHTDLDVMLEKRVLMIIGTWTRIEVYQILGMDSQSSLY